MKLQNSLLPIGDYGQSELPNSSLAQQATPTQDWSLPEAEHEDSGWQCPPEMWAWAGAYRDRSGAIAGKTRKSGMVR